MVIRRWRQHWDRVGSFGVPEIGGRYEEEGGAGGSESRGKEESIGGRRLDSRVERMGGRRLDEEETPEGEPYSEEGEP